MAAHLTAENKAGISRRLAGEEAGPAIFLLYCHW